MAAIENSADNERQVKPVRFSSLVPSMDSRWFEYDSPFRVKLRHTDQVLLNKINNFCTKKKRGGFRTEEEVDEHLFLVAYARWVVEEWEHLVMDDGVTVMECTESNVIAFMEQSNDFRRYVVEESAKVSNFVPEASEDQLKKLKNSSL